MKKKASEAYCQDEEIADGRKQLQRLKMIEVSAILSVICPNHIIG